MIPLYKRAFKILASAFFAYLLYNLLKMLSLSFLRHDSAFGYWIEARYLFEFGFLGIVLLYWVYEYFSYLSERREALLSEYRIAEDEKSKVLTDSKKKTRKKEEKEEPNLENLAFFYSEVKSRLLSEIKDLGTKSNANLAIGLAISIFVLGYSAIFIEITTLDSVLKFIPRVSFVILVEFLAYFFLGLYKRNLEEIKYYQNELTNVDFKFMAFFQLIENHVGGDKALLGINELLKTERNRHINKGQTTEELERMKYDYNAIKDLISPLLKAKLK